METPSLGLKPLDREFTIPGDLFKFVGDSQDGINDPTQAPGEFFYGRQPNPYAVLTCPTNIPGFIIGHNFIDAGDAGHLGVLTGQTLEAYGNATPGAAEEIKRGRFNGSLLGEGEANDFFCPRSCWRMAKRDKLPGHLSECPGSRKRGSKGTGVLPHVPPEPVA